MLKFIHLRGNNTGFYRGRRGEKAIEHTDGIFSLSTDIYITISFLRLHSLELQESSKVVKDSNSPESASLEECALYNIMPFR